MSLNMKMTDVKPGKHEIWTSEDEEVKVSWVKGTYVIEFGLFCLQLTADEFREFRQVINTI